MKKKQDGRLAPAYFSQEYKFFDRLLLTVKNETTVENLVNESFLQKTIPPLLSISYAKEVVLRFSFKTFCLTLPRNFVGEQFGVSEKNVYRKILRIKMGYHQTPLNKHCLTVTMKFVGEHFCVSKESWYRNIFSGLSIFLCHRTETKSFAKETFCFSEKSLVLKKIYV